MKKTLLLLSLWVGFLGHAQQVRFSYDTAGNQIQRTICINCKTANKVSREMAQLKQEEFQKDTPTDAFAYYPNPVKEQLYLTWTMAGEKKITRVEVYNVNGQKLQEFDHVEQKENQIIDFNTYSAGYYLVVVHYSDEDKKTLRIVKREN